MTEQDMVKPFRVLSLDGGGSLGVYSLGVLMEVEKMAAAPFHEKFDLIYGTSTGAIIAAMIALGHDVDTIQGRYFDMAPDVMKHWFARGKSTALRQHAEKVFGERMFDNFKVDVGIVATHLEFNRPMIFKRHSRQGHGSAGSFQPGFGCTIAEAVVASCAAYPVFQTENVSTKDRGRFEVVDGGFAAANPTLFALADALGPLGVPREAVRVLSVGTGKFATKRRLWNYFRSIKTIQTLLGTGSNSVEILQKLLFSDVHVVRVNETFADIKTDFIESDRAILDRVFQRGRKTFEQHEAEIRAFFGV